MMGSKALTWLALLLWSAHPMVAHSQPIGKHPRVAELEDRMIKDASSYLKGRFPAVPFLVSVSVDPLRRAERSVGENRSEKLPFFEVTNDEIQDEWDDPQVSLSELMLRVKRVVVSISIPKNVSEQELLEIREAVFSNLHLVQARDEIKIERRAWSVDAQYWVNVGLVALLFVSFLVGMFLITRKSVGSIVSAISSAQLGSGGGGGGAVSMPSLPLAGGGETETGKLTGGVRFNDPIKIREVVRQSVHSLVEKGSFPNLRDLVELDKFGARNPGGLGGLITEFPIAIQKKVFGYSYQPHWMNAFNEPGELDNDALQVLQRIEKNLRTDDAMEWESLLICVWRLGDQLVEFVKGVKQEDAFAILHAMPKSIAVPTARKAFPGSWGVMLDPHATHKTLSASEMREITRKALELKPLNDFNVLEHFRHDTDLLEYLRTADVSEEREIYEASPKRSVINKVRAPFYRVLDLDDAALKEVSQVVPMDQWVLALFNVSRPDRKRLVDQFSEKQRFLFLEMMKRMDAQSPERTRVGMMRERIAQTVAQYMARKATETKSTQTSEASGDDVAKAA